MENVLLITIIAISYIASVFIGRWLNKILYKRHSGPIIVGVWFIPVATIIALLILVISEELCSKKMNWFSGKNW